MYNVTSKAPPVAIIQRGHLGDESVSFIEPSSYVSSPRNNNIATMFYPQSTASAGNTMINIGSGAMLPNQDLSGIVAEDVIMEQPNGTLNHASINVN